MLGPLEESLFCRTPLSHTPRGLQTALSLMGEGFTKPEGGKPLSSFRLFGRCWPGWQRAPAADGCAAVPRGDPGATAAGAAVGVPRAVLGAAAPLRVTRSVWGHLCQLRQRLFGFTRLHMRSWCRLLNSRCKRSGIPTVPAPLRCPELLLVQKTKQDPKATRGREGLHQSRAQVSKLRATRCQTHKLCCKRRGVGAGCAHGSAAVSVQSVGGEGEKRDGEGERWGS